MAEEPTAGDHPILILHVEDDPAHAELVRRGFEGHRIAHQIRNVASGEEALDYLWRRGAFADPAASPRPDVVLLDLRLPGADGLEILRQIRASEGLASLPIVVLTSSEADADRLGSYRERIDAYLVKPMSFDGIPVLLDVIRMVLSEER